MDCDTTPADQPPTPTACRSAAPRPVRTLGTKAPGDPPAYAPAISAGTPGNPWSPNGSPASRTRATIAAATDGSISGS